MKRAFTSLVAVLALMMALAPATSAAGRHPEIEAALDALRNARTHLQEARHDFHGHRVDAIRAIDESIRQLKICMEYD